MVGFVVKGIEIRAETKPDLFSPKSLDQGTRLLLSVISTPSVMLRVNSVEKSRARSLDDARDDKFSILDWGCGWGAISLYLGKLQPTAKVVGVDSDIGAVKAAKANVVLNELTNVEIVASQGFSELPTEQKFDLIASNPPTHRGREVVDAMIAEAKGRLNPEGSLVIVVEARLKPWVARQMKAVFGDYKILKRGPKNVVLAARKA